MKNVEKYKEYIDRLEDNLAVNYFNNKITHCANINCLDCAFNLSKYDCNNGKRKKWYGDDCNERRIEWLYHEEKK